MTKHPLWQDEYFLFLMQIYEKKPVGMKALYSRPMVNLSLELHIPPHCLYEAMFFMRRSELPSIRRLWKKYGNNENKLKRDVERLRKLNGYGDADVFYEGVDLKKSFEKMFEPVCDGSKLTPVMLIMILNTYFRLTPNTMVVETPEIKDMAKKLDISPEMIVEVMEVFQQCDPYLNRTSIETSIYKEVCTDIWDQYGNENPEKLSSTAAQLEELFK